MNRITPRQAIVAAIVWLLVITGAVTHVSAASTAHTVRSACGIEQTGMFNPCAHLDTTQVQNRRGETVRWSDGVAVCMSEDASDPGQAFPCRWDGRYQGNKQGGWVTYDRAGHNALTGAPEPIDPVCDPVAFRVMDTARFTWSADEIACLGSPFDYRAAIAYDYGMTPAEYAWTEAQQW